MIERSVEVACELLSLDLHDFGCFPTDERIALLHDFGGSGGGIQDCKRVLQGAHDFWISD